LRSTNVPTLVVARHAKADRPPGIADVDRPLRRRGEADARRAGGWLREAVGRPDLLVCSPARRAVQTGSALLAAFPDDPPEIRYRQSLYDATAEDLLEVVTEIEDAMERVVMVGHNPSVSTLVGMLTGEPAALRTCGIAVLRWNSPWSAARARSAALLSVTTPRAT
jgi:phosphohistidine phosphatase